MSTMSPRQRLLAALRREPLDRQPVHFWNFDPFSLSERWQEPFYRRLATYARRYTEPLAQWRPHSRAHLFYSGALLDIESQPITYGGRPAILHTIHAPAGDLTEVWVPLPEAGSTVSAKRYLVTEEDVHAFLSIPYQPVALDVASLQRQQAQLGERAAVAHLVGDALQVIASEFDPEQFAIWCATRKAEIVRLVAIMAERIQAYVRAILEAGGRPVFLIPGPEFATPPLLSPALFHELVVPYDQPLVALMHRYGCVAILHCHGRLASVLDDIVEVGCDGLHPLEEPPTGDITLAEAKRRAGDRITFVGNVPVDLLFRGSRAEVRQECVRILEEGAAGGGLILSPAAAPYQRPFEERSYWNYLELVRTARAWAPDGQGGLP